MGRRREQRIAISLPVLVRGSDSTGSPFEVAAVTRDISCTGARLEGLASPVEAGKKVEVQCHNQKAWYRVQWVAQGGAGKACRAGLRCLEPAKFIWGVTPPEWEADTFDPSVPPPIEPPALTVVPLRGANSQPVVRERRQFPRRACRFEAHVTAHDRSVRLAGTITDIALGGCYMEMLTPLPVDSTIELSFGAREAPLQITGVVRSSHTGMGMGVMFTGMSPEDFENLRRLTVSAQPSAEKASPKAVSAQLPRAEKPVSLTPTYADSAPASGPAESAEVRETLAAVVRILCRKQLLTRAEILEELGKLKLIRT